MVQSTSMDEKIVSHGIACQQDEFPTAYNANLPEIVQIEQFRSTSKQGCGLRKATQALIIALAFSIALGCLAAALAASYAKQRTCDSNAYGLGRNL